MKAIDLILLCCDEEQYISIQSDDDCEELTDGWSSSIQTDYPESMTPTKIKWFESEVLGWLNDGNSFIIFI